jgi:hypothetical protein
VENLLGVRRKNHWVTQTIPLSTITGIHESSLVSTRGIQSEIIFKKYNFLAQINFYKNKRKISPKRRLLFTG